MRTAVTTAPMKPVAAFARSRNNHNSVDQRCKNSLAANLFRACVVLAPCRNPEMPDLERAAFNQMFCNNSAVTFLRVPLVTEQGDRTARCDRKRIVERLLGIVSGYVPRVDFKESCKIATTHG